MKFSKISKGILLGVVAGIIDVVPMIMQNLTWDSNLSAFSMWVVSGFVISTSDLKLTGYLKGLLVSLLLLIPSAVLIAWKEPIWLIPVLTMTVILGSLLGYAIEKTN